MNTRTCTLDGCDKPHFGHGWCSMHYTRWRRHGDPTRCAIPTPRGFWKGDRVGYAGAHYRTRIERGPASEHDCQHCGGPAREWALNHDTLAERLLTGTDGGRRVAYSTNPADYMPLCPSCHRKYDNEKAAADELRCEAA
jgi:hypothetical protein